MQQARESLARATLDIERGRLDAAKRQREADAIEQAAQEKRERARRERESAMTSAPVVGRLEFMLQARATIAGALSCLDQRLRDNGIEVGAPVVQVGVKLPQRFLATPAPAPVSAPPELSTPAADEGEPRRVGFRLEKPKQESESHPAGGDAL